MRCCLHVRTGRDTQAPGVSEMTRSAGKSLPWLNRISRGEKCRGSETFCSAVLPVCGGFVPSRGGRFSTLVKGIQRGVEIARELGWVLQRFDSVNAFCYHNGVDIFKAQ